jgi:hypothetical protein
MAMGKKAFIAVAVISLILSLSVAGMQAVKVVKANPYEPPPFYPPTPNKDSPTITMDSPTNTSYTIGNVTLNFTISQPSSWVKTIQINQTSDNVTYGDMRVGYIHDVYYQLDGNLHTLWSQYPPSPILESVKTFTVNMFNLTTGLHYLTVKAACYSIYDSHQSTSWHLTESYNWNTTSEPVLFSVGEPYRTPSPSPSPSPSLPSNDYLFIVTMQPGQGWDWHYNISGPLILFYRTAEPLSWVGYSLDEAQNVTIVRNGTELPTLPDGKHSLKLYGNDTEGKMYASWVIWFSTHQNTTFPFAAPTFTHTPSPSPSPTPSPTQQPPIEPTPRPIPPVTNIGAEIMLGILLIVALWAVYYFRETKKQK